MINLKQRISNCTLCQADLPQAPNPVLQFSQHAKLILIGQAPGRIAHETNKPWNDKSGIRLRLWLGLSEEVFYDEMKVALLPMGFCFPGTGKTGDLAPRKECAPEWHNQVLQLMPPETPKFLIGSYAQNYYLRDSLTLTQRCKEWQRYTPAFAVLPHPSPRNNIWIKKNPWFEAEVLPEYRQLIKKLIAD